MRIIDILNKKANKELADGFRFCYKDIVYKFSKKSDSITNRRDGSIGLDMDLAKHLNGEVLLFKEREEE